MFLADRLEGEESVRVLLHLEECDICYERLPERNPQEVIDRILGGDDDEESEDNEIESGRSDKIEGKLRSDENGSDLKALPAYIDGHP